MGRCLQLPAALLLWALGTQLHVARAALTQPSLVSQNGHLLLVAGDGRNITLTTSGAGCVNVNGENLVLIAKMARNASQTVDRLRSVSWPGMEQSVQNLQAAVEGPRGLKRRVAVIEEGMANGTVSGPSRGANVAQRMRVTALTRRVFTLERQVRELRALLTTNECASNPCRNGGECQDKYNGFVCRCPDNWKGVLCDTDVNECANFAGTDLGCQNGATCVNKPGTYECACAPGWYGVHCNRRNDDCSQASNQELCGHGLCVTQHPKGYACICDQGWTTNGVSKECSTDVNECTGARVPCSRSPAVSCVNLPGSFRCASCPSGFEGDGFYCADVDECARSNGGCSSLVTCINTHGSRVCTPCPPGYQGDGTTCAYVGGPCSSNNGGCHPNAICADNSAISASYVSCTCSPGFSGSGVGPLGCIPDLPLDGGRDPCQSAPCLRGRCMRYNIVSFRCICPSGFSGKTCEQRIDACVSSPCLNSGVCNSTATGFRCTCQPGFGGDTCADVRQACGGRIKQQSGSVKYPDSPSGVPYSPRISCAWVLQVNVSQVVNVTFSSFHLENSPDCSYDWLQVNDGDTAGDLLLGKYCGRREPFSILSTTHRIYLWFRSDQSIGKDGFEFSWNAINPTCGGEVLTTSHGTLSSPGAPGKYPPNRDCYWLLRAPNSKRLQFHFFSLMLNALQDNCSQDFLAIHNGATRTEPLLAKFCNTSRPAPLISASNTATVHFHSDADGTAPGFQMSYMVIEGFPGCGGVLTAPLGDIVSPRDPGSKTYKSAVDCEWRIQQAEGERVQLTFLSFKLEESRTCSFDFVEIREGLDESAPLVARYCGNVVPRPYSSTGNVVRVRFRADFSNTQEGFHIKYQALCGGVFGAPSGTLTSPGYPGPYPDSRVCIYRIEQPPGKAIRLDFVDFEVEETSHPRCNFDYVQIRDGDSENSTLIGQYCGGKEKTPPSVISTFNYLWIKFSTDSFLRNRGFKANFTTIDLECGGILRGPHGIISSPRHPEVYPHNMRCTWVLVAPAGHVVQLTFVAFSLEYHPYCIRDYVQIFDNSTVPGTGGPMGKWCAGTLPPVLTSSDTTMTVVFSTDSSVARDGFTASFITMDTTRLCGGSFYTSAGVLTSPNYPGNYLHDKDCTWVLTAPAGQQIMLNVTAFQLEKHHGCNFDYLEIKNGGYKTSPLVGKFCGTDIPKLIPSLSNQIYLHFVSDTSRSAAGFRITWDATATGCGGTLTAPSGSITTPNYPAPYSRNAECFWRIVVSQGSRVQLTFVDMELENHSKCRLDYLEVRDGLDSSGKLHGKFCSSTHPPNIVSKGNELSLKFRSDVSQEGRGFHLKYDTLCDTVVTGYRGVIESPNFPAHYPGSRECLWTIKVARGNRVNITFSHFATEVSDDNGTDICRYDYLSVTESDKDDVAPTDTELGRFCGTNLPPAIASTKDHVFLRFVSDPLVADIGFRLEWVIEGCGGIMDKELGSFTSPGFPSSYLPAVNCEWLITAPFDQSVQLNITELSIERSGDCRFDYLQVWSGTDSSGTSLGSFCHTSKRPVVITTTGSSMYVRFVSDGSISGRGFKANYTLQPSRCGGKMSSPTGVVHSPNYPMNYGANDDCTWLIELEPAHTVRLQFVDFDVEMHSNCSMDYVKVYDGDTTAAPLMLQHCGNALPAQTQWQSSGNKMLVHFKSDGSLAAKGFKANYTVSCGARIVTDSDGVLDVHDTVNTGEGNKNCTWTIVAKQPDARVTLTVTHLELAPIDMEEAGECLENLEVRDGDSLDAPLIGGKICGPTAPPAITSSGAAMTVTLSAAHTVHVGQFAATYSVASASCGGNLTSERGSFLTPGYPVRYPANAECVWTLNASPGNRVQVSFGTFNLAQSESCNADYLEVREGDALGRLVGVYCTDLPSNISASNKLWIKFRSAPVDSGAGSGGSGFQAYYTLLHGNELTGPKGQIASPLYPREYIMNGEFGWRVTVQFGFAVSIVFSEFYLDKINECVFYLAIYDGYDDSAPVLLRACGGALPAPVTSSANVVYIKLLNNPMRQGTLFFLDWTQVPKALPPTPGPLKQNVTGCGDTVVLAPEESRTLTSPGFPTGYAGHLNCEWLVETQPGFHVSIRPTEMQLETGATCQYDNLQVFYGRRNQPDWRPLRTLCWPNATSEVLHATALMRVIFHSDPFVNKTGFSAQLYAACGGWLTADSGVMEVRGLPSNMSAYSLLRNVECQWNISARAGRRIALKFTWLNLSGSAADQPTDGCGENYILLKNGGNADSPLLGAGKFCGTALPSSLETTGNRAFIKYRGLRAPLKGFRLEYRQVSHSCGGSIQLTLDANSSSVSSPNYPQIPSPHTECAWVVMAPAGRRITLEFVERFDLTFTPDCSKAAVEVRDGGTQGSRLLGRYCNNQLPDTLNSVGNMLHVRFFTDVTDPKNGFKANLQLTTCGGRLRTMRGVVTSPGHPGQYPPGSHCVWRIVAPRGHTISFDLQVLDVSTRSMNCSQGDYLRIEEPLLGNDTTLIELGTYCRVPRATLRTTSNEAVVTFHSENIAPIFASRVTYSGFRLAFNASIDGCGGQLETPAGSFQSPGYPLGTPGRACIWSITVPKGRRVKVTLLDFELEVPLTSLFSPRLVFYNDHGFLARIAMFNGSSPPVVVRSTGNTMMVSLWTYRAAATRGFKASYSSDEPAVCGGTGTNVTEGVLTPPLAIHNLTSYLCAWEFSRAPEIAQTLALTIVNASIGTRDVAKCEYSQSKLVVANGDGAASTLTEICGNYTSPLIIRSPYPVMNVKAIQGVYHGRVDFWARVRSSPCGGVLTGPEERITSPGFPKAYQPDTDCAWAVNYPNGQAIQVNITRLNLEPDPTCARDFLAVRNGPLPTSPLLGRYCADAAPVLKSQSNRLWIEFHSDGANQGSGFEALLSPVVDGCGGTFQADKGEIFTPGFPGSYPAGSECEWELRTQPGYTMQLTFIERFFLEQSAGCTKDFIEVFDWLEGAWSSLGRYCGRQAPPTLNATGNQMRVLFRTDNTNSGDGFKAQWGVRCGGLITARERGQFVSPGFPKAYSGMLDCNYTLVAPGNAAIALRFEEFSLEAGGSDCRYDNVTLFGYPNTWSRTASALGTYCGTNTPPPRTFRKAVSLIFKTDQYLERKGFRVSYELRSCGGSLTAPGEITSPRDDSSHLGRLNCTWVITAPAHQVIMLKFSRLELEHSVRCHYDAVSVYDGPWTNSKRLVGEFCGNQTSAPPVAKSTTNQMTVQFKVGVYQAKYTFAAAVAFTYGEATGCGGSMNLTSAPTALTSPDVDRDGRYEALLDCHWLLLAPNEQTVNLQLSTLDLAPCRHNSTETCSCDFLEVRDGPSQFAELLGRYCLATDMPPLRSSGSAMWVRFVSDAEGAGAGFRAQASAQPSVCGPLRLNVTSALQELTSPGWPAGYPDNIRCRWSLFGDSMGRFQLHFASLDLNNADGACTDSITFADLGVSPRQRYLSQGYGQGRLIQFGRETRPITISRGSRNPTAPITICGRSSEAMDYYSESSNVEVTFTSDQKGSGKGFKLVYSKAVCTRNFTGTQGRILVEQDPNSCYMTILAPENHTIALYFAGFHMRPSEGCVDRALEVREDGPSGAILAKLCGFEVPRPIFSATKRLWLHSWRREAGGLGFEQFDITYVATDKGRGCGGRIFNYGGTFASPQYPENVRNVSVCRWDVTVPQGSLPVLKFQVFDIGPKATCATDFLELIDVDPVAGTEAVRTTYCGQDNPAVYLGETGALAVRYTTSVHNGGTGWVAKFMSRRPGTTIIPF